MPELLGTDPSHPGVPAFFAVNGNLFTNFDVIIGPSNASVVVTPFCLGCGSFGGDRLVAGFGLDFGGQFTLTEKGRTVFFLMEYDFFPSLTTFDATSAFLHDGTINGAGDNVHIDMFSSGFPGPDLNLSCPSGGCLSNVIFGTTQAFSSPTSTHFRVIDEISMVVDADTGGTPFVRLNSFDQTFRAVPEPGTIVLFGTALLGLGWLARRRRA
jgi:hypothetical protein